MQEDSQKPNNETPKDKTEADTIKSIEEGKKAIDVEKKVGEKSEEDSKKDAEQWRNEG